MSVQFSLVNQATDPLGNVATVERDANGLAVVTIDRLNRISLDDFDGKGNITRHTYPDRNDEEFTYNGFSQPLTHTDARDKVTTFTYDAAGNLTDVEDPLHNHTTMTYTGNGRVATVEDARSNITSYQYDGQDRLTTVTHPGAVTNLLAYDARGNLATVTDERKGKTRGENPVSVQFSLAFEARWGKPGVSSVFEENPV